MSIGSCGSLDQSAAIAMFEYQNLDWISTSVDAIVILNKWYTPLTTTRNVKAWYLVVEQTNNGATNENIEVELNIDGTPLVYAAVANSGTTYYIHFAFDGTLISGTGAWQIGSLDVDQSAPLETRSLQVRVRQTSVVDITAAQIEVNMIYATKETSST